MSEPAATPWDKVIGALVLVVTALTTLLVKLSGKKDEPAAVPASDQDSDALRRRLSEDRMREIAEGAARDAVHEMERELGGRIDKQDERMDELRRDLATVREGLGEIRGGFEAMVKTVQRVEGVIDRTLGPQ